MDWTQIITTAIVSIFGAGGIAVVYLDRVYKKEKGQREQRCRRFIVTDELLHAIGRWIYHQQKVSVRINADHDNKYFNGDFQAAFEKVEAAEQKKKELDRRQLAELNDE